MKKIIGILLIGFFVIGSLSAYTVEQGKIKLVLNEISGRFSVYSLNEDGEYISLFSDEDPRTSGPSILLNNMVYKPGPGFTFDQTLNEGLSPEFVWESRLFIIKEQFQFIRSSGSFLEDGIKMTITITNKSEVNQGISLRYIFDTYLGEDSRHFWVNNQEYLAKEKEFTRYNAPDFCVSAEDLSEENIGMQFIFSEQSGVTRPDKIIFSNWKRLNDASWDFTINESRNFNLLPYSINDSALGLYYNQIDLVPGDSQSEYIVFGEYSPGGFSIGNMQENTSTINQEEESQVNQSTDPILRGIYTDLQSVRNIQIRIDEMLNSGQSISDSDIQILQNALADLYERKETYTR